MRAQAWTGLAHALVAQLGVGTVTASALTLGLGVSALFAGVGFTFLLAGLGLVWVSRAARETSFARTPVLTGSPA